MIRPLFPTPKKKLLVLDLPHQDALLPFREMFSDWHLAIPTEDLAGYRFDIIFWTAVLSCPERNEAFDAARLRLAPGGQFFRADARFTLA